VKILGIIPVRFKSTRFPGKALADVNGKSMVQRVYEQASGASGLDRVVVATDYDRIFQHIRDFGGEACMTSEHHPSGTDRCREAFEKLELEYDFIINIQGDEPFINPRQIEALIHGLSPITQIATQARLIKDPVKLADPNCVKVIFHKQGEAVYFSRTPVPYLRNVSRDLWISHFDYHQHIGLYAYRADILQEITQLPVSPLEKAEGLEQLRWLEHSYTIKVLPTKYFADGIDSPEDLEKALAEHS
jgi:3-deoxy-manno-octulosonate cytidylyltransferase (CMP-KDO synthetase)